MDWVISHGSALEYWRKASAKAALAKKSKRDAKHTARLPSVPLDAKWLRKRNHLGLTTPMEILVGNRNARKTCRDITCRTYVGQGIEGGFIRVAPNLFVSSPELCFMQLASELTLIKLIEIGYELCGGYRLEIPNNSGRGFRDDLPLTSVAELSAFVEKTERLKGRKNARKALRHITDNSKSPRETILSMLLTLPNNLGGYGFSKPKLNYRIDLPPLKNKTGQTKTYYCDLYWPEVKMDVEYDSDLYHTQPEQMAMDAIKKNDLTSLGIKVYTVTSRQVASRDEMQRIAEQLSKVLGKRLRLQVPKFAPRCTELRKVLLQ